MATVSGAKAAGPATPASRLAFLTLDSYIDHARKLLALERDAEVEAALASLFGSSEEENAAAGVSLARLSVTDTTSGLFGRTLLTLSDPLGRALPAHSFTVGDIGGLRAPGTMGVKAEDVASGGNLRAQYEATGVITKVTESSLTIALDDSDDSTATGAAGRSVTALGDKVRLDKLADDVTFKRLRDTLDRLAKGDFGLASRVFSLLFGNTGGEWPRFRDAIPPLASHGAGKAAAAAAAAAARADVANAAVAAAAAGGSFYPTRPGFNESQLRGIEAALRAEDVAMIHGPPGTGKTTTVAEYIKQEVMRGRRVLACAPSNVAVDNLLERLHAPSSGGSGGGAGYSGKGGKGSGSSGAGGAPRCVRLGHPARLSEVALAHSLEAQVAADERTAVVADVRKELNDVYKSLRSARDGGTRRELRAEQRRLRTEVRKREEHVVASIVKEADVVLCTATGAASKTLLRALAVPAPGAEAAAVLAGGAGSGSGSSGGGVATVFRGFDVVVIDEVAQGMELACLIPAMMGAKLVIAGDHMQVRFVLAALVQIADHLICRLRYKDACSSLATFPFLVACVTSRLQLPPTVISDEAARNGLAFTLADRFVALFGDPAAARARAAAAPATVASLSRPSSLASASAGSGADIVADDGLLPPLPPVVHLLDVQYRMHEAIMTWSSGRFYGGKLRAHGTVASHRLSQLPGVHLEPAEGQTTVSSATLREVHGAAKEAADATLHPAPEEDDEEPSKDTKGKDAKEKDAKGRPSRGPTAGRGGKGGAGSGSSSASTATLDPLTAHAVAVQSSLGDGAGDFCVDNAVLDAPLLLIDTAGCDAEESGGAVAASSASSGAGSGASAAVTAAVARAGASKCNVREADAVAKHVAALLAAGVRQEAVAVITPYNAQVGLLRALLQHAFPLVEVRSVDGYQGREKEAVVISMVRSNASRSVGFLADFRRMNVAVTRARRHVAIVADSDTVSSDPHLRSLLQHAEAHGEVRSAAEYLLDGGPSVATAAAARAAKKDGAAGGAGAGDAAAAAAAAEAAAAAAAARQAATAEAKRASARKLLRTFIEQVDAALKAGAAAAGAAAAAASSSGAEATPAGATAASSSGAEAAPSSAAAASLCAADASWTSLAPIPVGNLGSGGKSAPKASVAFADAAAVAFPIQTSASKAADASAAGASLAAAPVTVTATAVLELPAGLNAFDRRVVHEAADEVAAELGVELQHESIDGGAAGGAAGAGGDAAAASDVAVPAAGPASAGGGRRLIVRYSAPIPAAVLPSKAAATADTSSRPAGATSVGAASAAAGGAGAASSSSGSAAASSPAGSSVPSAYSGANSLLKALHDKRMAAAAAASAGKPTADEAAAVPSALPGKSTSGGAAGTAGKASSGAGKGAKGGAGGGAAASASASKASVMSKVGGSGASALPRAIPDTGDDDDALLDALLASSKHCACSGCKKPVTTTGTTCAHCRLRFCYSHGLPEEHGCGDAARAAARSGWAGAGGSPALGGKAGVSAKASDEWKRDALARSLSKKIDEAAAGRTAAAAGKKDGDKGKGKKK